MIAQLTGLITFYPSFILLTTNDVGYRVLVSNHTRLQLTTNTDATLAIYTHVKEDILELYGFLNFEERELFTLMLSVSGVGPRTALGILDNQPSKVIKAVQEADVAFFTHISRVGKKLAQKIIIELKNKLGGLTELQLGSLSASAADVVAGLQALGYDENTAESVVRKLDDTSDAQKAIKQALNLLAPKPS